MILVIESVFPRQLSCPSICSKRCPTWKAFYCVGHLQLSILSVLAFPVSSPTYIILCFTFKICYSFHFIYGGYIKALLGQFLFRRLQLIIQNQDLEIFWYLGTCMPQWQVSLLLIVDLHHWPLIERFRRMFDTSTHLFTVEGLYYSTLGVIGINGDFPRTC